MNRIRLLSSSLLAAGLFASLGVAQFRRGSGAGGGGRGFWGGGDGDGPMVRTEGGELINGDTVRTARESAPHSMETPNWTNAPGFERDVFTFARIHFAADSGGRGTLPAWVSWLNDYPDSDLNLSYRLQLVTSMKVDPDARVLKLTDPTLAEYPFIYMVKPGRLLLRDEEVPILSRYLRNGGVLMADDFWGDQEWDQFERQMRRVLPESRWRELPISHPLFHCVFDLKGPVTDLQVPSIRFFDRATGTMRNREPFPDMQVRAWLDERQRLMIIATHNTDNGDGWEREGEDEAYFRQYSEPRAFPLAINILYYAMTH